MVAPSRGDRPFEPRTASHVQAVEFDVDMQRRMLYAPVFHLDANLINAKQEVEAVNQLEKWRDDEVICLAMAGVEKWLRLSEQLSPILKWIPCGLPKMQQQA